MSRLERFVKEMTDLGIALKFIRDPFENQVRFSVFSRLSFPCMIECWLGRCVKDDFRWT